MPDVEKISDETHLIQKAVEGDKQAFGQLYEHFSPKIFNYLYYRLGNTAETEDMTETVFLKAWECLPDFQLAESEQYFRAWLYRIAHNLLVDHWRTKKEEGSIDQIDKRQSRRLQQELQLEKRETISEISEAIRELDSNSQHVIASRFIAGMSHRETAKSLGLSESNVRVIQFRALKKLRMLLEENYE